MRRTFSILALALLGLAGPRPCLAAEPHRSPVALCLTPDGSRLLTANQTSGSVSLVDPLAGRVLAELTTGDRPAGVAISADGTTAVVSHWYGYDLAILDVSADSLSLRDRVPVGPEPRGVAISPDGTTAFVALGIASTVVRVDLDAAAVTGSLDVGKEPRGLALAPDGSRLLVASNRSASLTVIDPIAWQVVATYPIEGDNLRQVAFGPDQQLYVANMRNRGFATNANNIDLGWVLGQRVTRVDPSSDTTGYETLSLDPRGRAASDVHGLAFSPDGAIMAVASGGTHEVLLLRTDGRRLPWRRNGSRDLMAPDLVEDPARFRRVELGGRPTELAFAPSSPLLYVANYLADAVQVVDAEQATLVRTIKLGAPPDLSPQRLGEVLFHDATRSFNQWYSCNTCHSDGHTNGGNYDTMNDGWHDLSTAHTRSQKKAVTLRGVADTGPWTWHGWQQSLDDAVSESFTKSMQGKLTTTRETQAVVAYLKTLEYPPNPFRPESGPEAQAIARGKSVFRSATAACASCHSGPQFTDGQIHAVGLREPGDVYDGYNPPSLRGVYDKAPYLHDGRAATLRELLTGPHSPPEVSGSPPLDNQDLDDLIAYLRSL